MTQAEQMRFRKGDLLAIFLVIALAAAIVISFLPQRKQQGGYAEIYLHAKKIKTVSLLEDQTFTITDRYTNEITIQDGRIAITGSDCPGEDCIHIGYICSPGRTIVCLPNGLEIRIVSQNDDVDFVVT